MTADVATRGDGGLPILGVVHGVASVGPTEIAASMRGVAKLRFYVRPGIDDRVVPLLSALGEVVPLDRAQQAAPPDAVLTFAERQVRTTAALAAGWGLPYHSPEVAADLTSKARQRCRFAEAGLEQCRHQVVDLAAHEDVKARLSNLLAAVDQVGTPAVVKPVHGDNSRDVHLLRDRNEVGAVVERLPIDDSYIVEEFFVGRDLGPFGPYVSVETVTIDGVRTHLAITGKLPLMAPFRETGQFWPAVLLPEERSVIPSLVDSVLEVLSVRSGLTHTELALTEAGPRVIEVNGRLGGYIAELAARAGMDDVVRLAAEVALNRRPRVRRVEVSGVLFQHYRNGPIKPMRLRRVDGVDELRETPWVDSYRPHLQPGEIFRGGVVSEFLDFVSGRAPDHETLAARIDHLRTTPRFYFDGDESDPRRELQGDACWLESRAVS